MSTPAPATPDIAMGAGPGAAAGGGPEASSPGRVPVAAVVAAVVGVLGNAAWLWRALTSPVTGWPSAAALVAITLVSALLLVLVLVIMRRSPWRGLLWIGLALLLQGAVVHSLAGYTAREPSWHAYGTDDAYISYRYAANLARGDGPVFNPGERVEGYSNLLYVLLLVPGFAFFDAGSIYAYSVGLNLLLMAAAVLIFCLYVYRRLGPEAGAAAALLLGLCPIAWMAVAMGLETPLVLLLQIGIWIAVCELTDRPAARRPLAWLCLAISLAVLARADGFLLPAVAVIFLLLVGARRAALTAGATLAAAWGAVTTWRLLYYGQWLPNSYYVKVSGPLGERWSEGLAQLGEIAFDTGLAAYLAAFAAAAWVAFSRRDGSSPWRQAGLATLFGLVWPLYYIYVGGDIYQERFLVVLFPLGVFALLRFLAGRVQAGAMVFCVLVVSLWQLAPLQGDRRFQYTVHKYDAWISLGKFLGRNHPGEVIAVDAAGKIPFFSDLQTIDMLGLNNERIARLDTDFFHAGHNKFDVDYIFGLGPDLIATMALDLDMNFRWGLLRPRYEAAGYRLRYLVDCNKFQVGRAVVDVGQMEAAGVRNLIIKGYRYGVLQRVRPTP